MKRLSSIENLLSSLEPRNPSSRLKHQLFGSPTTSPGWEAATAFVADGWKWMTSARHTLWTTASAVFLAAALLDVNAWVRSPNPDKGYPVLAALSNQSWTACLSLAEVKRNLPASILDWTNEEHIPLTLRSLDNLNTNDLLPKL